MRRKWYQNIEMRESKWHRILRWFSRSSACGRRFLRRRRSSSVRAQGFRRLLAICTTAHAFKSILPTLSSAITSAICTRAVSIRSRRLKRSGRIGAAISGSTATRSDRMRSISVSFRCFAARTFSSSRRMSIIFFKTTVFRRNGSFIRRATTVFGSAPCLVTMRRMTTMIRCAAWSPSRRRCACRESLCRTVLAAASRWG